jgi:hypothetical protein
MLRYTYSASVGFFLIVKIFVCTPWSHLKECRHSSTHSKPRGSTEKRDQLHAAATLPSISTVRMDGEYCLHNLFSLPAPTPTNPFRGAQAIFRAKLFTYNIPHSPPLSLRTYSPMKMERTECSETLAFKIQAPGNNPKENIRHSKHGESLKSRTAWFVPNFILGLKGSYSTRKCRLATAYLSI